MQRERGKVIGVFVRILFVDPKKLNHFSDRLTFSSRIVSELSKNEREELRLRRRSSLACGVMYFVSSSLSGFLPFIYNRLSPCSV